MPMPVDQPQSDALVFFGATGDLAYKQIFPSLQRLAKRGLLNGPVIGVAKSNWTLDQFRERARDSVEKHGGVGPVGFPKLLERLQRRLGTSSPYIMVGGTLTYVIVDATGVF